MQPPGNLNSPLKVDQGGKFSLIALLSEAEVGRAEIAVEPVAGFQLNFIACDPHLLPGAAALAHARAIIVEVDPQDPSAMNRLPDFIARVAPRPVIAAVSEPTHSQTRQLLHLGAIDVVMLPLRLADMAPALELARKQMERVQPAARPGRIISFVKSVGGVGTTSIATQAGCLLAEREAGFAREVCLIDLDLQFGNGSLYLGMAQKLTVADLIAAGSRADGSLLRSVTSKHESGLSVISAPVEIMPLESVNAEQMSAIVDLAAQEFATVILDMPLSWTNWSLSLVARSDVICLITELSIPSLRQARRQIDFLEEQGVGTGPLRVIINRYKSGWGQSINLDEAAQVLRRPVSTTIGNDFATMSSAIDQGLPIRQIRKKTRVEKDIETLVRDILSPRESEQGPS